MRIIPKTVKQLWQTHPVYRIHMLVGAVMIVVLIYNLPRLIPACTQKFTKPIPQPQNTSLWSIAETTLEAEVLWQKADDHVYTAVGGATNTAVSGHQFVYLWQYYEDSPFPCQISDEAFIAYDLVTGDRLWDRRGETGIFRELVSTSAGYAFIASDSVLYLMDTSGNINYRSSAFPSRSVQHVFDTVDGLYLPTYSNLYHLPSPESPIQNEPISEVVAVFDDYILTASAATNLYSLKSRRNPNVSAVIISFPQYRDVLGFRHTALLTENTLILYESVYQKAGMIHGYDVATGDLKWSMQKTFYPSPLVLNNTLILYETSQQQVEFFDIETGQYSGFIRLQQTAADSQSHLVASLAGNDDIIVIGFNEPFSLLAIHYNPH